MPPPILRPRVCAALRNNLSSRASLLAHRHRICPVKPSFAFTLTRYGPPSKGFPVPHAVFPRPRQKFDEGIRVVCASQPNPPLNSSARLKVTNDWFTKGKFPVTATLDAEPYMRSHGVSHQPALSCHKSQKGHCSPELKFIRRNYAALPFMENLPTRGGIGRYNHTTYVGVAVAATLTSVPIVTTGRFVCDAIRMIAYVYVSDRF